MSQSNPVYIEIGPDFFKVLEAGGCAEMIFDRQESGALTIESRERALIFFRELARKNNWNSPQPAYCAIGSRGVSLRRLTLPASGKDEFEKVLLLQIESEFPLAPSELAWGFQKIFRPGENGSRANVVAIKKNLLHFQEQLLRECGIEPFFTVAMLARNGLCPETESAYSILEVGEGQTELATFENGEPRGLRVIGWGTEKLSETNGEEALAGMLRGNELGAKVYICAKSTALAGSVVNRLRPLLSASVEVLKTGDNAPSALAGLKRMVETRSKEKLILLRAGEAKVEVSTVAAPQRNWGLIACALALACLALRYAEMFIQKPRLEKQLTAVKEYQGKLPSLDQELNFLQYVKSNQTPYLDTVAILAAASPPGSKIENLTMVRRGDIQMRGSMQNAEQAVEMRTKLLESGFFSNVVLEEQNPSPDGQKLVVRLSAKLKPEGERKPIAPDKKETEKIKDEAKSNPSHNAAGTVEGVARSNAPSSGKAAPQPGK